MNLREADGKVPVYTGDPVTPYILAEFPTFPEYISLFNRKVKADLLYKYYNILERRRDGMTLVDAGRPHYITKERVRQIEAKFLRLYREAYLAKPSSERAQLGKSRP